MDEYNLARALDAERKPFRVAKNGRVRYTLASSLKQCQDKFISWEVKQVPLEEFLKGDNNAPNLN
jgi:hypothetical protein